MDCSCWDCCCSYWDCCQEIIHLFNIYLFCVHHHHFKRSKNDLILELAKANHFLTLGWLFNQSSISIYSLALSDPFSMNNTLLLLLNNGRWRSWSNAPASSAGLARGLGSNPSLPMPICKFATQFLKKVSNDFRTTFF
jgi:hypothetical protein